MEKIGILTFHRASNYGAVLQAYALQTAFEELGAVAEIIDYRCKQVENAHNPLKFIQSHGLKSIFRLPGKIQRFKRFEQFRDKRLHLTDTACNKNIKRIESDFSALVVGSDQLWNKRFSGSDVQFFLPYDLNIKKYTYAVSLGDSFDQDLLRSSISRYGTGFDTISLREKNYVDLISSWTKTPCRCDLDPVFLLSQKDWLKIATRPNMNNPYILVYSVAEPKNLIDSAKDYSRQTGYQLIYLNSSFTKNVDVKKIRYPTPEEYIGWFYDAEMIFTNSFHGTAFSILFNKPFFIEEESERGMNIRSLDLIKRFHLKIHSGMTGHNARLIEKQNWLEVNESIRRLTDDSYKYLASIIENK